MISTIKISKFSLYLRIFFSIFVFFSPLIITICASEVHLASLKGPEGITNPLPINCFSLKQTILRSFFIGTPEDRHLILRCHDYFYKPYR